MVQDADGSTRTIEARFDPTYIEEEGVQTDAKKLMGGNRHGTSGEQRVTLDLADDYYEIAVESTYNYSKSETGKSSATHEGVKQWHYFVNDILFQEYGEKETTPYRVTINVKERSDGEFVYSFSAERQNERSSTRRTLHADVNQTAKGGEANAQPSVDSIRQSNDNSQEKSSDKVQSSMRDSAGRELTEAQQEYFKDSKVRDADGRLKTMYRGGNGTFTVFDRQRSKPSNLYGRGFYFTDSKEHANQYGKAREFYLNITHPVPMQETTITRTQLRKFLEAVAENDEDFSFENYGYGATVDSVQESVFGKSDFAMLYDVNQTAIGDMVAAVELFNEINGTDFDGLILDTETVAFRSEQIKSTNNLAPTKDTDIRYQQRDSDKTGDWDENGNPIFDNTPVRVEEATDFAEVKRRRKAAVEDYGLEKNESMRIESYVSGLAYELNKRMNSGILSEQDQNYADKVRDAFRKFPQYKGTTFRNLSFGSKKAFEEFLLGHKKGEVIKLKAFTSTSKSPNGYKVSGEFIVHMEFRGESNADISETYGLPRQQEVVYMPGIEIRVSDVTTANDGNPFIIVEEVGIRDQRANIGAEKPAGGMESNSENGRNFTGGENEFSDGVRGIERNRYVGNDALSERGKSDPGRSLTDSDVKNQQRDPRLSDRDVLRMAADMAQRDRSQRWSVEDLNRFDLLQQKLLQLDEANAELEALKEERKVLLAGRKVKELTREEQFDLAQNRNRTETQKGKMLVNRI